MATLGVNGKWNGEPGPDVAGQLGARVLRFPLDARLDPVPRILALKARGIRPLPVFASLDAFTVDGDWIMSIEDWAQKIGPHVDMVQILNEPDGDVTEEGASWRMSQQEANVWIAEARLHFPRPHYTLIGPGLVSGQPGYMAGLDLDKLDLGGVHAYAKEPANATRARLNYQHPRYAKARYRYVPGDVTPTDRRGVASGVPVGPMLAEYASYGLRLAVTEWHSGTLGMARYLRDHPSVELATVFCLHEYAEFGLVDHPEAAADFLSAAGGPVPQPEPEFYYQLGFKDAYRSNPALVGEPRQNESWPLPGFSSQLTTNGLLVWSEGKGLLFFDNNGSRYVWRGSRLERVA
jgi:hypothetical protein